MRLIPSTGAAAAGPAVPGVNLELVDESNGPWGV